MSLTTRLVAVIAVSALLGGFFYAAPSTRAQMPTSAASAPALRTAKSWGDQLQNLDPDVIAPAPCDMLVVDCSRDGSDALTAADVAKLKVKPDGSRRIVLSYPSIGEAETYRARKQLEGYGFIPYFADRALDQTRIGDLPDPTQKPGKN